MFNFPSLVYNHTLILEMTNPTYDSKLLLEVRGNDNQPFWPRNLVFLMIMRSIALHSCAAFVLIRNTWFTRVRCRNYRNWPAKPQRGKKLKTQSTQLLYMYGPVSTCLPLVFRTELTQMFNFPPLVYTTPNLTKDHCLNSDRTEQNRTEQNRTEQNRTEQLKGLFTP